MDGSLFVVSGLTAAPGLAVCIYIFWRDKFEREPMQLLAWSFLMGMVSVVPALGLEELIEKLGVGLTNRQDLLNVFNFTFFNIGFSEEVSKLLFLLIFIFPRKDFNEPYDGITYAVMISMGFATVENILYVYFSNNPMHTAMVRMFTAIPAHASFAIIMGYFVGLAKFKKNQRGILLAMGLLLPAFSHACYNFFPMQEVIPALAFMGAILSLLVSLWLSLKAISIHQKNSPFTDEASGD